MKKNLFWLVAVLSIAVVAVGCGKSQDQQASINTTGFELDKTEELAQLPQSSSSSQQASIEVLPIETSPVTPAIGTGIPSASSLDTQAALTSVEGLSRNQQIQTALKAAGLYTGKIDGKIGPVSKKAIETFQANNGLKVDGKVGPQTWAALEQYLTQNVSTGASSSLDQ